MKMITRKEAALYYARRGWPIFPLYEPNDDGRCSCGKQNCSSPGKHPRTKHGVLDATTNEARILQWWTQWSNANIGLATGNASGILVLDIDPARGGEKSFEELKAKYGNLSETLQCSTGGGGRHLYFLYPPRPVGNRVDFMPGLDVRGDGGYVVLPPSGHVSGATYKWMKK